MDHAAADRGPSTLARVQLNVGTAHVPVDIVPLSSVITWIMAEQRDSWAYVVTPNLHLLRQVRETPALSRLYSGAALSLPDGWPVAWLASRLNGGSADRVAGADLFQALIEQTGGGRPLVLVGGSPGPLLDDLYSRCRGLGWNVSSEPAPREELSDPIGRGELVKRLARAGSGGVVVLGVGSPQKEELSEEIAALPGSGTILSIGMSINFSAGVVNRAPQFVRTLGLEWLYRALSEPRRLLGRYVRDARVLPTLAKLNPKRR